ncbi:MAG: PIN/TRAM domain-containing protein [Puniceicoccaceae bacterium]
MSRVSNPTINAIRGFFLFFCLLGGFLISFSEPGWNRGLVVTSALLIGVLVVLIDIYLEGFSLRGLTALTFGIGLGTLVAILIDLSPLFDPLNQDEKLSGSVYLVRLTLFVILMYLGAVIALRGRDEFNLIIPYVKFVPETVESGLVIVDSSALIDGRILAVCESGWLNDRLVIPRFVLREIQSIADSPDPHHKNTGRIGLQTLNKLRELPSVELIIHDSDNPLETAVDAKLIFVARTLRGRLLTTDYNLARRAEVEGVPWLNLNALARALNPPIRIGLAVEVELVKLGKDPHQGVGYLPDGSMVVVNQAHDLLGETVQAEVVSIIPTSGGRMIFAEIT